MSTCQEKACPCGAKTLQDGCHFVGTDFDICLPFGARLYSDNGVVKYEEGNPPADGTYTQIAVKSGCIVSASQADISTYTTTPCAPVPTPCDCSSSSSSSLSLATVATNLSTLDSSGNLLTRLYAEGGSNVSVSGNGTKNSPLVISAGSSGSGSTYVKSANASISISGSGTRSDYYVFKHAETLSKETVVNGLTFDTRGHLTGVTTVTSTAINGIVAQHGITCDTNLQSGIATLSLTKPTSSAEGTYVFGAHVVKIDDYNRITSVSSVDDEETIALAGVHNMESAGDSFSYKQAVASRVKITVEGSDVSGATVKVDSTSITMTSCSSGHIVGLTKKLAAGSHSVTVSKKGLVTIMLAKVL